MAKKKTTDAAVAPGAEPSSLSAQIEKAKVGKKYVLDLKVNSPASMTYLGAEGIDSAPAIVRLSKVKGLDVIAITDLYSGDFVDRMVKAAHGSPLTVIPGVSLRCRLGTCDDVILSCLFPETTTTTDINALLDNFSVPPQARGSTRYVMPQALSEVLAGIEELHGFAIPTRIDKTPNRMSVLGDLVEKYGFRAFDLTYLVSAEIFKKRWPKVKFQLFSFSERKRLGSNWKPQRSR